MSMFIIINDRMRLRFSYLLLSLLCITGCKCTNDNNGYYLASSNQEQIIIQFKYDTPINGYIVKGFFYPFSETSETGQIEVTFYSPKTGRTFVYSNVGQYEEDQASPAKFSGYNIDKVVFSEGFESWKKVDSLVFTINDSKELYPDSPLFYAAEFQFFDVDKDGYKELLINQWDRHRGGNYYDPYEVTETGLRKKTIPGCTSIDNMTSFNIENNHED